MKYIHSQPATPTAWRYLRHPLSGVRHLLALSLALLVATSAHADFNADLRALTAAPHRLAGSEEGRAAADYVEKRLREIGVSEVHPLEFNVWRLETVRCELQLGGRTISLSPILPNIVVPPATLPEGLTKPLLYAGRGRIEDYGSRVVEGHIVVLDYDSGDAWETAFALGASAVIFIGDGTETPGSTKQATVPSNQLRFYASRSDFAGIDLTQVHDGATLTSQVRWKQALGRNIIARIPGTAPDFADGRAEAETIILSAQLDSLGAVPHRSPGARGAANVAALLEAAETLRQAPPKRDVVLMFVDNDSWGHQGAREVYDALMMLESQHATLVEAHASERDFVQRMKTVLQDRGLAFGGEALAGHAAEESTGNELGSLARALRKQTDHRRDDLAKQLQVLRLRGREFGGALQARADVEGPAMDDEIVRWDAIRRALHHGELDAFVALQRARAEGKVEDDEIVGATPEEKTDMLRQAKLYPAMFDALIARTMAAFDARLAELNTLVRMDEQRAALRTVLAERFIVLHAHYNFSGDGSTWAVVVGDWTDRLFKGKRSPKPEGDTPGYYGRVLGAFREVVEAANANAAASQRLAIEPRSLTDPTLGTTLAPGPFFSPGYVAGVQGIYNVSFMTAFDARLRDGHPADTVEHLSAETLRTQAQQATRVVQGLGDSQLLSLPRVFKPFVRSKYAGWDGGKATGDAYVGLQVSGSLSEDRPAGGAMLATWPAPRPSPPNSDAWQWLSTALVSPAYQPFALQVVDQNGRFNVISYQSEMNIEVMTFGVLFDEQGRVTATSARQTQAQKPAEAMRVDLMTGTGYGFTVTPVYALKASQLKVLRATADAEFRLTRGLWGQDRANAFFYISDYTVEDAVKIFQPMGPVVLGVRADESGGGEGFGEGVNVQKFVLPPYLTPQTASDLWRLNEDRLAALRSRGVTSADLELLHSRSKRLLDEGADNTKPLHLREGSLQRSSVLSHRVYQPLRSAMDDLVHAIVVLLLLAIPFAFALERLVVCSTTIYGRIAGFTIFFLITFGILYLTHPGFSIASTPIIIFLAFAIILLSALVIYIVVRKFQTELKAMQGQASGVHDAEVSRTGTLLAAVGMGMSTMRRRPTRTFLTAITVVALTFTILCFASFSRVVGVRSIAVGLKSDATAPTLLLRKLDYSAVPRGVPTLLDGVQGKGGLIADHWWLTRPTIDVPPYTVARLDDGRSVELQAVMGVPPDELVRWPQLAEAVGAPELPTTATEEERKAWEPGVQPFTQSLQDGDVYLPPIVQELLDLEVGQEVLLFGRRVRFAGVIDATALQRLKHLDGESIIPVDFQTAGLESSSAAPPPSMEEELLMADDVEKDFVHLSADQVVITSADRVRSMGGEPNLISIYPGADAAGERIDATALGKEVAPVVVMPVWAAGIEGVDRMLLTVLTEVSGGMALFVPLLLGGLIIFGTLLGSIQDREKEIYTFSALGLSPGHVGVLFFAEATVYAVVGGMGGQLLAQFVALSAAALAKAGYIAPASINYSSTNALFAIGVVMLTVIVSAIYPAIRASKSANPGLARSWKMPPAEEDTIKLTFPFTVSAYDITGVISFLAEHFRRHDDAGLGSFAASNVKIIRDPNGYLQLSSDLALAPFDLGVTQHMVLTAIPSEIEGVDEVAIRVDRSSGARGDWYRANKVFMRDLRRQFLLWRTLSSEMIEHYRMETLETLGESRRHGAAIATNDPSTGFGGPVPTPA